VTEILRRAAERCAVAKRTILPRQTSLYADVAAIIEEFAEAGERETLLHSLHGSSLRDRVH